MRLYAVEFKTRCTRKNQSFTQKIIKLLFIKSNSFKNLNHYFFYQIRFEFEIYFVCIKMPNVAKLKFKKFLEIKLV